MAQPAVAQTAKAGADRSSEKAWQHYPEEPQAPTNAPNVLLILTDDVGFSAGSAFGGPIPTPVFDSLAKVGLSYNEFHTTAMCSPTRAALLTGRNHHAVGYGAISNVATDKVGYTSVIPDSAATIADILKLNGYVTAFLGKNHNTPVWETGPTGPFENWPNGWGFDYFYGFNGAMSDQFHTELVENRNPIDPPFDDPTYNLDRDLADHLLKWLQVEHTVRPDKPFFAYWAPGTLHSPHQAPADWIARFKGKFDMGWDRLREESFERQKSLGIIPQNADLTPRPQSLPAWDSLSDEQQHVAARMMEVAAAQLAQSDYQIGRVIDWLKKTDQFDNTLIFFIQGDNGASIESLHGANNEMMSLIGLEPSDEELARSIETHGGPFSFGNYPSAWGWATNSPFQWGKQVASHLGGLRDALVVSWPDRIRQKGGLRTQFGHVIDIAPTIYEAVGISPPESVDGVAQQPIDGTSLLYSFNDADAAERHRDQYFEMLGNRAFYSDGWLASTTPPKGPWDRSPSKVPADDYEWELYNLREDYSQAHDIARKHPEKLAELRLKFDRAADRFNVRPIKADIMARLDPSNRPDLLAGRTSFTYYPGDTRYPTNSFPTIEPGWKMTAHVIAGATEARGPLVTSGDFTSGYGLMLDNGFPMFLYNPAGRPQERVRVKARQPLSPGDHEISVRFERDKSSGERASRLILSVDGENVDTALVPITYPTRGNTYVGRAGLAPLLPEIPRGELIDATLQSVVIKR
ncbi:sulfatase-like hydrolase/transferase [Altererythrobacter endophyticus]|uniref:Sulfatase-like hydrolase/transferase n=1 Tax=Altericroceibacterium endophyticum TaxID=1808508 RepID=A0A6I4T5U1_9SPHN|nr:sulfatase-like hydrolase/transferase [Altericroceibacterium endophyticum]